jgi:hypothetical protein
LDRLAPDSRERDKRAAKLCKLLAKLADRAATRDEAQLALAHAERLNEEFGLGMDAEID